MRDQGRSCQRLATAFTVRQNPNAAAIRYRPVPLGAGRFTLFRGAGFGGYPAIPAIAARPSR